MKKCNILIIILFMGMITIPQLVSCIFVSNEELETTENRNLSEKPKLELATIEEYPTKFEAYYNDHLPFREKLIKMWASFNYKVFNATVDDSVIIGKQGWLFYRGEGSIEQAQGINSFSEKEKKEILTNLQSNINKFKEKNIDVYVFIIPNKENLYKEYLPNTIPIKSNISKTEELIQYIRDNSDINIIYPKQELLQAKEKYQIYEKYDTHWNNVGALSGAIVLESAINPNFYYDINNLEIEKIAEKSPNDLARFANLEDLSENKKIIKNFYPEIKVVDQSTPKYERYISTSENDKKIFIIGDSFIRDIKQYLSKLYNQLFFVHIDKLSEGLIEEIQPDIIVIEVAERFSFKLANRYYL